MKTIQRDGERECECECTRRAGAWVWGGVAGQSDDLGLRRGKRWVCASHDRSTSLSHLSRRPGPVPREHWLTHSRSLLLCIVFVVPKVHSNPFLLLACLRISVLIRAYADFPLFVVALLHDTLLQSRCQHGPSFRFLHAYILVSCK